MLKFFLHKTDKRISYKELEKRTSDDFLLKLRTIDSIECTVMDDLKMCFVYVVFFSFLGMCRHIRVLGTFLPPLDTPLRLSR